MSQSINFEGSPEIGAYTCLTNTYCIIGKSVSRNFYSSFQETLTIPIVETLINTIPTVGSLCQGNSHGLLVSYSATDQELQHIRNSLPECIKILRVEERLNALGNVILTNDRIAVVHPELDAATVESVEHVLGVEVVKNALGSEPLVGTFGVLNNVGLLVHPLVTETEMEELSTLLEVRVIAGTANRGSHSVGGGVCVNDWIGFVGHRSTVHERTVIESVFKLVSDEDEEAKKKALIESYVN